MLSMPKNWLPREAFVFGCGSKFKYALLFQMTLVVSLFLQMAYAHQLYCSPGNWHSINVLNKEKIHGSFFSFFGGENVLKLVYERQSNMGLVSPKSRLIL